MNKDEKNISDKRANHLINEKSPYLLQHAYNPVNWYGWNNEAFELAGKYEKPIFLSIGYSTCHWCHVMERESFEDMEIAGLMNKTFINIKVDREERPDIDGIYMRVCQMLTGSGGWPLTIIMAPDKKPFFAGTYFPKYSMAGRIGMKELIVKIDELWRNNRQLLLESAVHLTQNLIEYLRWHEDIKEASEQEVLKNYALNQIANNFNTFIEMPYKLIEQTYDELRNGFDNINGGFGLAPKFPMFQNFTFLLRYSKLLNTKQSSIGSLRASVLSENNKHGTMNQQHHNINDENKAVEANYAFEMVIKTLLKMRNGGIYDQLGYGFHRYSTDEKWLVPHFEKMLYDQALAIIAYTEAYWAAMSNPTFRHRVDIGICKRIANEIIDYLSRVMTSPEGGFYSAEDADSEGEEGKFYLWEKHEIDKILGNDADLFCKIFNVKEEGNFIEENHGKSNKNILYLSGWNKEIDLENGLFNSTDSEIAENDEYMQEVEELRMKLFQAREQRIKPFKDDKILTDWNGLMIKAIAIAGRVFNESKYIDCSRRALDFILSNRHVDGRLFHRCKHGEFGIDGMLDNYAFIIDALLELYQSDFDISLLKEAIKLFNLMYELFWDNNRGGFFVTSKFHDEILVRNKEIYDGAIPSGNSVALSAAIKLWKLTGNTKYSDCVEKTIHNFKRQISKHPSAYTYFISSLMHWFNHSIEIVIAAKTLDSSVKLMIEKINKFYNPFLILILKTDSNSSELTSIAEYTNYMRPVNDMPTIYVCKNFSCEMPTNDIEEALNMISR